VGEVGGVGGLAVLSQAGATWYDLGTCGAQMRIERLYLRDTGPFREVELEFPRGTDPDKADVYMFVGQNGSGKSTLLEAMAQMFTSSPTATPRRFRARDALIALKVDEELALYGEVQGSDYERFLDPWFEGNPPPSHSRWPLHAIHTPHQWLSQRPNRPLQLELDGIEPSSSVVLPPIEGAVFGYGAARTVERSIGGDLGDPKPQENPLRGAATLEHMRLGSAFSRWVANADARHALNLRAGDHEAAGKAVETLGRLESVLSKITERHLKFSLEPGTLAVQLELDGVPIALDLLPEGLKALLAWLGDLFMRMERIWWTTKAPIVEQPIVLLLDEIDVHQHPVWQRRIVPILQELLPNAQIFLATHSPFVVGSASDAFIYPLSLDKQGVAQVGERLSSLAGYSYPTVLQEVFGVPEHFDIETQQGLDAFYKLRDDVIRGEGDPQELHDAAVNFPNRSPEIDTILGYELRALTRRAGA
jgi:energy-coupling factor transporter ATP-binding protein EcfA2